MILAAGVELGMLQKVLDFVGSGELGIRGQLLGRSPRAVDAINNYGNCVSLVHAGDQKHQQLDTHTYVW